MKNVLFISYDGMTDPLGQSQVIPYLAGLTRFGYTFTILSCDKPDKLKAHKNQVLSLLNGLPIQWVSIPYHKNPPVLSSVYDYWQLRKKAAALHKQNRFDMVHTRPGVPTLVALWLKKKFAIRFLNDVRGFWADERVDGGMWNTSHWMYKRVYRFFKAHEFECLEKADGITCLTEAAKKEMQGWKQVRKQPLEIEVIPCSADLELFNPHSVGQERRKQYKQQFHLQENDMVFSYLGSIGGWYLTDEMLRFCKLLSNRFPHAKFLFISPHRHEQIIAAATAHGLPSESIITAAATRNEVPVLLSLSQFAIFFIKPCYSKLSSSPTKHGEIMAMGIPVITNDGVGDVSRIVEHYHSGILLKDFSSDSMSKAVEKIAGHPGFSKEQIRQGAIEYYNLETAVQKYRSVYERILN